MEEKLSENNIMQATKDLITYNEKRTPNFYSLSPKINLTDLDYFERQVKNKNIENMAQRSVEHARKNENMLKARLAHEAYNLLSIQMERAILL